MQAFVAGATGLTGREVVAALCAQGIPTVAHVRPDSGRLIQWQEHFGALGATVDTTAWEAPAMTETIRRVAPTLVFSLLGTTRKRMRAEGGDYAAIDFGLTALLIDAVVGAGLSPRFVYLSAVGVTPDTKNAYMAARARAEAHLEASGLPWTIARPSFILGDRDESRPMEHIGASMADGALAVGRLFGGRRLADRYQSNQAPTLASALVRLAQDPDAAHAVATGADLR